MLELSKNKFINLRSKEGVIFSMPMQIGLDELLGMLLSRAEETSLEVENQKRFGVSQT